MKRSVTVQIAGVKYALKTEEDDRYVKQVAAFVDGKIRDVQKHTRTVDTQAVAVLTALTVRRLSTLLAPVDPKRLRALRVLRVTDAPEPELRPHLTHSRR